MRFIRILRLTLLLILVTVWLGLLPFATAKSPVQENKEAESFERIKPPPSLTIPGAVKKPTRQNQKFSPYLKIKKVYLKNGTIHVTLRNTGKGNISLKDYSRTRLYVTYPGLNRPWSWNLRQVDLRHTSFKSDVDFDTQKTIQKRRSISAWIDGSLSDDRWQGVLTPKNPVSPKPSAATAKGPTPSVSRSSGLKPGGNQVESSSTSSSVPLDRSSALQSGGQRVESAGTDNSPSVSRSSALGSGDQTVESAGTAGSSSGQAGDTASNRIAAAADRDQARSRAAAQGIGALDGQGTISSVSPQPVEVGADLTIIGSDFGQETGTVLIAFRESTEINCRVRSWHSDRIVITIPEFVAPMVGESASSARIRVIAEGREYGPSILADIAPNQARLTPVVETVSPKQLFPNEIIYINGQNFLSQGPQSRIDFRFFDPSGRPLVTYTGTIVNWNDTTVAVRMINDITGFHFDVDHLNIPFEIEMRNNAGNTATIPDCLLKPVLERKTLTDVKTRSNSGKNCDSTAIGTLITSFHGMQLKNGWKVVGTPAPESKILECSCFSSCYILPKDFPAEGSINAETSAWAFFKKQATVETQIVIEGPKGLPYE